MILGSHVSIRHGYLNAAKRALQIGGRAFQYFPKNPRSLTKKSFNVQDANACAAFCRQHNLVSIAHTPYPTNLCPRSEAIREATVQSVLNDLDIANQCGSIGVVVHFGRWPTEHPSERLEGYKLMIDVLNEILQQWTGQALILLENNAGHKIRMGTTLEELVQVRELCDFSEKIGFCLDTCHAFASGLWEGGAADSLIKKCRELGYLQHLAAIHLNDSVYPARSYQDRHANIGQGKIGIESFKALLAQEELNKIPFILETPSTAEYSHEDEIKFLYGLNK